MYFNSNSWVLKLPIYLLSIGTCLTVSDSEVCNCFWKLMQVCGTVLYYAADKQ